MTWESQNTVLLVLSPIFFIIIFILYAVIRNYEDDDNVSNIPNILFYIFIILGIISSIYSIVLNSIVLNNEIKTDKNPGKIFGLSLSVVLPLLVLVGIFLKLKNII